MAGMMPLSLAEHSNTGSEGKNEVDNLTGAKPKPVLISAKPNVKSGNLQLRSTIASRIKSMSKEEYLAEKQKRIQQAIENCNNTDDSDACKEKLRMRIQSLNKFEQKAVERLKMLEQKRMDKIVQLKQLKNKTGFRKFQENYGYKARNIAAAKAAQAKEDYLDSKEEYIKSRQKFNQTKERFNQAKAKVKACEGDDSEECEEIREKIMDHAKEHLTNIADRLIAHVEQIISRIESNEYLDEEEAGEMISKAEDYIAQIESVKDDIGSASTKEDIQEATGKLREVWTEMEKDLGIAAGKMVNARIGGIVVRSEQLSIKLERILERMEENNIDTDDIDPLIAEFDQGIENAKSNYSMAMEKFREAKETTPPNTELIKEGHDYMKDAHNSLKDAASKLREIVIAIKNAGGAEMIESDEADEAMEEAEEEAVGEAEE